MSSRPPAASSCDATTEVSPRSPASAVDTDNFSHRVAPACGHRAPRRSGRGQPSQWSVASRSSGGYESAIDRNAASASFERIGGRSRWSRSPWCGYGRWLDGLAAVARNLPRTPMTAADRAIIRHNQRLSPSVARNDVTGPPRVGLWWPMGVA